MQLWKGLFALLPFPCPNHTHCVCVRLRMHRLDDGDLLEQCIDRRPNDKGF